MKLTIDKNFWENKYEQNKIGWDLGEVSSPIKQYIDQLTNKNIRILIPGAGNSHEAEYIINEGFTNVTVIDIAKQPLENIKKRVPNFPQEKLICHDFFEFEGEFDLIIEQTFFCALDPKHRKNYVQKMHSLLAKKGTLAGLLFDAELNEDHPPFSGSKEEYIGLFEPKFELKNIEAAHNSVESRAGKELFINFIKK
ncbi:MAG: methyltransferase domain-containing protein [Flavobacteriales bacterium]